MLRYSIFAQAIIACAAILFGPSVAAAARTPTRRAPAGFRVLRSTEATAEQRDALAKKFGAKISTFSNTHFSVHGRALQLNIIKCADSTDAAKIHKLAGARKTDPAFCIIADSSVYEFICNDPALAILAAFELGFKPKPEQATYKISFRAAPVEKADYTSWKKLSNLFASASLDSDNLALKSRIEMMAGSFRFGNEITLRTLANPQKAPSYSLKPNAAKTTPLIGGDLTKYTFRDLPREVNIPSVSITATLHTSHNPVIATTRKAGPELLAATEFWPSDDSEIIALAAEITANCNSQNEKIDAILRWLLPGRNIKFMESVTSARSGVKNVFRQKFGQAWDFSDCFVTLARASKVPCRQVGGWFYSQSAHVWAEIFYEGFGWQQVEPTGGGIVNCGIYHIPYTTSETGIMSFMYLSKPRIEFIDN